LSAWLRTIERRRRYKASTEYTKHQLNTSNKIDSTRTMPPTPQQFIKWTNSEGKALLLRDIEEGTIPETMAPQEVFDHYAHLPEFSMLEKNEKKDFTRRLASLRKSISLVAENLADAERYAARDAAALAHDRQIYPEKTHNDRGERLFHNSPARLLLREDIDAGKYEKGKPQKLRETREEYQEFSPNKFRKRIHQEIQTKKWHNSKWGDAVAYGRG
jgi:hypothetical protein